MRPSNPPWYQSKSNLWYPPSRVINWTVCPGWSWLTSSSTQGTCKVHSQYIVLHAMTSVCVSINLTSIQIKCLFFMISIALFLQCGQVWIWALSTGKSFDVLESNSQLQFSTTTPSTLENCKHQLNKLLLNNSLTNSNQHRLNPVNKYSNHKGVIWPNWSLKQTSLFVDDNFKGDINDQYQTRQTIATSIEAIYIILEESNLALHQDPVTFDKLEEMTISWSSNQHQMNRGFIADKPGMASKCFPLPGYWSEHRWLHPPVGQL